MAAVARSLIVAAGLIAFAASADGARAQSEKAITVWTFLNPKGSEGREVALRTLIEAFEKKNPGTAVRVEPQVWNQLGQKFILTSRTGGGPDVVFINGNDLLLLSKTGAAADLKAGLIDHWSAEQKADFLYPKLIERATIDGKTLGVPLFVFGAVLYYRKDLVEKAGYSEKDLATWSGFHEVMNAVQTDQMRGYTLPLSPIRATQGPALTQILEKQDEVFDKHCRPLFATPAGAAALLYQKKLFEAPAIVSREDTSRNLDDSTDVFLSGRAASVINVTARYQQFVSKAAWGDSNLGITGLPSLAGRKFGPSIVNSWYLSVAENSKQKQLAIQFVDYLVSSSGAREWTLTGLQPPLRASVLKLPELASEKFGFLKKFGEIISTSGTTLPECRLDKVYSDLNIAAQKVVVNNVDPLEALKEVGKQ